MKYAIILGKHYEVQPNERKGFLGYVIFGDIRCDIMFQIEGYYITFKGRRKSVTDFSNEMPVKETV